MEDGGARDGVVFKGVEVLVGVVKREELDVSLDGDFHSELQEVFAILAGIVGDAANHSLVVEQVVAEARDGTHVNAAEHKSSALAERLEGRGDDFTGGREDDGGIERNGRLVERVARPFCAKLEGEALMTDVARAGVNVDLPMARDLNGDMRRCAEAIKCEMAAGLNARRQRKPMMPAQRSGAACTSGKFSGMG